MIPADLADLLTTNVLAHVSATRRDGSIAHYLMWVDYDGEHILTSSPVGSRKGAHWRRDPRVTLSVVDRSNDWRYLIVRGRVVDIRPDHGLAFIDRMSERYTGGLYRMRQYPREIFLIRPDHGLAFIDRMSERYTGGLYRMRQYPREIFLIQPEHVRASSGRR